MTEFSILDLSTDDSTLVLSARYPFPPERAFRAWLDPAALQAWLRPDPDCRTTMLTFDPRVGGEFSFRMTWSDSSTGWSGRFIRIDPPHRLEMTWTWDPEDDVPYPETLLTVEIEPDGEGSRLTLTHSRLRSPESRDAHGEGWTGSLTKLHSLLNTP
ncbi:MAG: SRPBCC domain-containing protein [Fimbriimonadaceae bacterium]|nr:SRPBCC domain-containing protein [Fimbriimonadaceae bacterium]